MSPQGSGPDTSTASTLFHRVEDALLAACLVALMGLPVAEMILRMMGTVGIVNLGSLLQHLTHYAVQSASEGLDRIDPMVARLGPDVLADLRDDDAFVAQVLEMAHRRSVYLTGLDQLAGTLTSLSAILGGQ